MSVNVFHYRRNLPHIHPQGAVFFLTFRLAGSIPLNALEKMRSERLLEEKSLARRYQGTALHAELYKAQKRHFARYDKWLDSGAHGPVWLRDARVANEVTKEIKRLHGERYCLFSYCIMPNHVHLLVDTADFGDVILSDQPEKPGQSSLRETMRLIKGRSARSANRILQRSGRFWQDESYDHFVRDEHELENIIRYILYNPVVAGLAKNWQDWPFTYLSQEMGDW